MGMLWEDRFFFYEMYDVLIEVDTWFNSTAGLGLGVFEIGTFCTVRRSCGWTRMIDGGNRKFENY